MNWQARRPTNWYGSMGNTSPPPVYLHSAVQTEQTNKHSYVHSFVPRSSTCDIETRTSKPSKQQQQKKKVIPPRNKNIPKYRSILRIRYIYQKYRWPAAHACCQNWQTGVNLFATHTHKHLLRKNFYARNTESTTKQTKHTTQTKSEMRRSTKKNFFWTQTAHTRSTRIRHRREWSRRKKKYTKIASQQIEATAVLWSYPTYTQHTSAPATSTYGNHKPNRG